MIVVHRGIPRVTECVTIATLDTEVLKNAALTGINRLERRWACPLMRRAHADRAGGIVAGRFDAEWTERGIGFTLTAGHEHQANADAEGHIRCIGEDARVKILRYSDRVTRRKLFHYATKHSSDVRNMMLVANMPGEYLDGGDILPFGSRCWARTRPAKKVKFVEPPGVASIYLCPDPVVPH